MFNWLVWNKAHSDRLTDRKIIRTITTQRGTAFDVFEETAHYVMCHEPENLDTPAQALLDFEAMAAHGYWLCHIYHGVGAFVVFEKRVTPTILQKPVADLTK